jgi:hypothetical protein
MIKILRWFHESMKFSFWQASITVKNKQRIVVETFHPFTMFSCLAFHIMLFDHRQLYLYSKSQLTVSSYFFPSFSCTERVEQSITE